MRGDAGRVGVLGARSPVGDAVAHGLTGRAPFVRFSRQQRPPDQHGAWSVLGHTNTGGIDTVISLIPVWALSENLATIESMGCRRLVALSSTSRFTKKASARTVDRELAERLRIGEKQILAWGRRTGVEVTLLRPTMIYGHERDGNVATIRSVLRRFRVFPVVGSASGRRQPVHIADVAWAAVCVATTPMPDLAESYTLSGGEVLTYREMVDRVRRTVPGPTAVLRVPSVLFPLAERLAPRSRTAHTAAGMADRMSRHMTFDHSDATEAFGYSPRAFDPSDA